MESVTEPNDGYEWFAMRDLKRANANLPAWRELREHGFEVFTPLKEVIIQNKSGRVRKEVPAITDLLFVHSTRDNLDRFVRKTPTLQYRYIKGAGYQAPMTVRTADMNRFIQCVSSSPSVKYFGLEEISEKMIGKKVRLVGGSLDGHEGNLLSVRGMRTKRLIVELPGIITAAIEVSPEYIQMITTR